MNSKSVLITGATGLLGRQVVREFRLRNWATKGIGLSRADGQDILKADLLKEDEIQKVLDEVKPQVVIHCAANRYPDQVEKEPEAARALNVHVSETLARLCAVRSILLIYISTEYVFPGTPGDAPYAATDPTSPTTLYGLLKRDGEVAVLEQFEKVPGSEGFGVVLRVPVLYGQAEVPAESAVNGLMDTVWGAQKALEEQGANAPKIKVDHWGIRFPTNTEDVARVCRDVSEKYLAAGPRNTLPKILHFTSEDKMTKYEICQTFAEIMGLSMDAIEANTEGNNPAPGTVQRPYNCKLNTQELQDLGISTATCDFKGWWRREVRAFRK